MKTKPTERTIDNVLAEVDQASTRDDCREISEMMRDVTGQEPVVWGDSMIGFGSYHYRYASGREGDWFVTGFSPRKKEITIYIMAGFDRYDELMERLGKYRIGKSCLYIKRLDDVDREALRELIAASVAHMEDTYGRTS